MHTFLIIGESHTHTFLASTVVLHFYSNLFDLYDQKIIEASLVFKKKINFRPF
jgi:hypothetical protein